MKKGIAFISMCLSVLALAMCVVLFFRSGFALDERISYELYFNENILVIWGLLFTLAATALTTIINLYLTFRSKY
ncbi:hypothetical protein G7062_07815 [Erysipelothrix sp. HDW6C]|uniref:hypothetical protein n=1 Tax=Erysipelothrix sp. HDW6C TaxID=2714930 RepID=UPI00140CB410|nr:hypothetical protein [Erysipelothrix sp. HDW6C]QIK70199.1 hypothetical protein G7062_07815 [Erysipelothrix sp. HDW6C]